MKFYPATRIEFAIWPLAPDTDLVQFVSRVWRSWIRSLAIRHLRRDLSSLPDWLLYDIGITRTDIPSIAVGIVDGDAVTRHAAGQRR
jgi:uncharacterized protein YjiS (DUF1127 family)